MTRGVRKKPRPKGRGFPESGSGDALVASLDEGSPHAPCVLGVENRQVLALVGEGGSYQNRLWGGFVGFEILGVDHVINRNEGIDDTGVGLDFVHGNQTREDFWKKREQSNRNVLVPFPKSLGCKNPLLVPRKV